MTDQLRTIVAVGASAGGVESLSRLIERLPGNFPRALLIALHGTGGESLSPSILNRRGALQARHVEHDMNLRSGGVYVARPNQHLVTEKGRARSIPGPRKNRHRPSINFLFESAAREYGDRTVGVILSGALDDGVIGLLEIKRAGGIAIVQDPDEALFSSMPRSALGSVDVDYCMTMSEIAGKLVEIANDRLGWEVAPRMMDQTRPGRE